MEFKSQYSYHHLFLSAVIILFAIYLKTQQGIDLGAYLWAEDGNVFINDVYRLGLASLWEPYAGYLHLYPRIWALLITPFGLGSAPYVFLAGWLLAFVFMAYVIIRSLRKHGVSWCVSLAVVVLIAVQPSQGQVFFTITNAQWFIGVALIVYVILGPNLNNKIIDISLLVLLCLTGPFSILVLPILIIGLTLGRTSPVSRYSYVIVLVCALIQIAFLLTSSRYSTGDIDRNLNNWLEAVIRFLSFGGSNVAMFSAAFWLVSVCGLYQCFTESRKNNSGIFTNVTLVLFSAVLVYGAGLWSSKHSPLILSPVGAGSRYFIIPYSLIYIGIALALHKKGLTLLVSGLLISLISFKQYMVVERPSLQFSAYVAFSKIKDNLIIPLNPQWKKYPGWHISPINNRDREELKSGRLETGDISFSSMSILNGTSSIDSGRLAVSTSDVDLRLIVKDKVHCSSARFLGVEAYINRSSEGWGQLFWSDSNGFSEKDSLKRYYPKGDVIMQFALPYVPSGIYLRFDPIDRPGLVNVSSVRFFCLTK